MTAESAIENSEFYTEQMVSRTYTKKPLVFFWGKEVSAGDYLRFCKTIQGRIRESGTHFCVDLGGTSMDGDPKYYRNEIEEFWPRAQSIVTPVEARIIVPKSTGFDSEPDFPLGGSLRIEFSKQSKNTITVIGHLLFPHGTTSRESIKDAVEGIEKRIFDGLRIR